MQQRWDYGDRVRLIRNVRNDGTLPGAEVGELLVRRGSVGHVVATGTFLIDQIIYSVHFLDDDRVVGCREEELIDGDEEWIPNLFEVHERVRARLTLASGGEVLVPEGDEGEVMKVIRETTPFSYHVHFDALRGRQLQVPEGALSALAAPEEAEHAH
jgi:nitrogen fixation protein NifZ